MLGTYGFDANGDTTLRTYGLYGVQGKQLRWAKTRRSRAGVEQHDAVELEGAGDLTLAELVVPAPAGSSADRSPRSADRDEHLAVAAQ